MTVKKFIRQLRKEATANPKKAAVLGMVAVVALWFWAPLLKGWISGGDEEPTVAVAATPASAAATPTTSGSPGPEGAASAATASDTSATSPTSTTPTTPAPSYSWQQLVEWMDNDPRVAAASFAPEGRDPFALPTKPVLEEKPQQPAEEAIPDVTPESLGLALSSTVAGSRSGVARINGRSYARGATVPIVKDGQQIEFTLAEIHPRQVILERNGKRFDLKAAPPAYLKRVELLKKESRR